MGDVVIDLDNYPSLPGWESFERRPLTKATCLEAQAVVDKLRAYAKQLREYYQYFEDGVQVRAYYGGSGNALAQAEYIRAQINANIINYAPHLRDVLVR